MDEPIRIPDYRAAYTPNRRARRFEIEILLDAAICNAQRQYDDIPEAIPEGWSMVILPSPQEPYTLRSPDNWHYPPAHTAGEAIRNVILELNARALNLSEMVSRQAKEE